MHSFTLCRPIVAAVLSYISRSRSNFTVYVSTMGFSCHFVLLIIFPKLHNNAASLRLHIVLFYDYIALHNLVSLRWKQCHVCVRRSDA